MPVYFEAALYRVQANRGKVGTSLKVLAHRPSIAWFGNLFGLAIEKSGTVEKRIHLLAQLRAAQIVECPFV